MTKFKLFKLKLKWKIQEVVGECLYSIGFKPGYSSGVCGSVTSGYGKLNHNGYWQYPTHRAARKLEKEIEIKYKNQASI